MSPADFAAMANAAVAEVPAGGNIPLGTTACQRGCACRLNGDGSVPRGHEGLGRREWLNT